MSLRERLAAEIAEGGPMRVSEYMQRCLHDPLDGYYATRPRLGADGDFITAPLVSQMFGELIGLWAAEVWARMGSPARVRLVEMGPGDGTLMSDMLRAARASPGFAVAIEVWLVETSGPLRRRQEGALGASPNWIERLEALPGDEPVILIANELLDCLPTDQFERTPAGWAERRIGLEPEGGLAFGLAPAKGLEGLEAPVGVVIEISGSARALGETVGRLVVETGGAALFIDYGATGETGDTLQALRGHRKEPPLCHPGEADLTIHADFSSFLAGARAGGGAAEPLLAQGDFLGRLGLAERASALAAARPDKAETIARQVERLARPDHMGSLFKVACVHAANLTPPGFEP